MTARTIFRADPSLVNKSVLLGRQVINNPQAIPGCVIPDLKAQLHMQREGEGGGGEGGAVLDLTVIIIYGG